MKIVHVGIMGDIRKEGMITQYIYDNCEGEHSYHWIGSDFNPPKADVYILHCMKNLLYLEKFITFGENLPLFGNVKIISLIHSSEPCMPSRYSDEVVVLTDVWKKRYKKLYDIDSMVIPGGIDLIKYNPLRKKLYKNKKLSFGKITRPEPGKFHKDWNNIVLRTLKNNKNAECRIICNGYKKLDYLKHRRMKWVEGIGVKDHQGKIEELSKLSVYIECHSGSGNTFVDTFNMSMLEAMALGIPVLMYKGLQEPMAEILNNKYTVFSEITSFEEKINLFLYSKSIRESYSECVRARAEDFSHLKMIERWNNVINN